MIRGATLVGSTLNAGSSVSMVNRVNTLTERLDFEAIVRIDAQQLFTVDSLRNASSARVRARVKHENSSTCVTGADSYTAAHPSSPSDQAV